MHFPSRPGILVSILVLFILAGCVKEEELPDYILPDEQVIKVLVHAHMLESKVENFHAKKGKEDSVFQHFDSLLFQSLSVDQVRYEKTIAYYADKPEKLNDLYESVVDSLSLRSKNRDIE